MNDEERNSLESLKRRYIDGQLTDRQRTELKRLVQRHPSLVPELRALRRQRELLGRLPVETPPQTLLADIQTALERNMILESQEKTRTHKSTAFSLALRRMAAVAAMLLIPLGLLGIVVFQIVRPAELSPVPHRNQTADADASVVENEDTTLAGIEEPRATESHLLAMGRLTLTTKQPIIVNGHVKKSIFSHQMLDQTVPVADVLPNSYQIRCSRNQLSAFIRDLQMIWPKCSQVHLVIAGQQQEIRVEQVLPDQMIQLLNQEDSAGLRRVAGRFAIQNRKQIETQTHPALFADAEGTEAVIPSRPIEPILTASPNDKNRPSENVEPVEVMLELCVQARD